MSGQSGNFINHQVQRYYGQVVFSACTLGVLAIFFWIFIPMGRLAYGTMTGEVEKFQFARQLKQNVNAADSLSHLQNSALKSMKLIQAVPSDSRASYILNTLMEGSQKYKLKISDISALNEISVGDRIEIPFEISISGGYKDLHHYLIDLENMDMVIKIRDATINSETINKPEIKAQLELSIYVQK